MAKLLTHEYYKSFEPLYNKFRAWAFDDYKFELPPLEYKDFINSVEKGLIKCIIHLKDNTPVSFLIYTTKISDAIELNVIYGDEGIELLLEEFLKETEELRKTKIVCYPLLGKQNSYLNKIKNIGFEYVNIVFLRFLDKTFNKTDFETIPSDYEITIWDNKYFDDAVNVIQEAFETSSDALFDPRFKSIDGVCDILTKITQNIYADFLPDTTSVLLYKNKPVGFCFMNITDNKANIPIVGIKKEHQGKGLAKYLLQNSMDKVIKKYPITEVNTCTDTENISALKMYKNAGFKEDYTYVQSYKSTLQ